MQCHEIYDMEFIQQIHFVNTGHVLSASYYSSFQGCGSEQYKMAGLIELCSSGGDMYQKETSQ